MLNHISSKLSLTLASALLIAGCGGSDNAKEQKQPAFIKPITEKPKDSTNQHIVIVDMATYGKGSQVGFAPQKDLAQFSGNYYPSTKTDFFTTSYKDNLYYIGRYNIDLIQKYNIKALAKGSYTGVGFSLNDKAATNSANAHAMAFVSDNKAYITRYGENKAWVVNPAAQTASEFKQGELDLSAYLETTDNKSKVVNMDSAVIANNKLFITLQRLGNKTSQWTVTRNGYVAVFNTADNKEIDTARGEGGLKGIKLNIKNPQSVALAGDYLYVSGVNYFGGFDGGIEKIKLSDYSSSVIYDDKKTDATPNNGLVVGKVTGVAVLNGNEVYTRIYHGYGNNSLAKVENGELKVVAAFKNKNITLLKTGPDGDLWLATGLKGSEQPKLYRLNKSDLSIKDSVELPQNAIGISFIKQ